MRFQVFIENEAGSTLKNHHDEQSLAFLRSEAVSCAYPYAYGFIIGTRNADGDCLDCFVITDRPLTTGQIVECEAVGLMEQTEDGLADHNVLGCLLDEYPEVNAAVRRILTEFVQGVFRHFPAKHIEVGRFLGVVEAEEAVVRCRGN